LEKTAELLTFSGYDSACLTPQFLDDSVQSFAEGRINMATQEIHVELLYERHSDGRYYVSTNDIPGFQMAGLNIDAIQSDLNDVVKDLLFYNSGFKVEELRWVPSLDEVKLHLDRPVPEGKVHYVISGTIAA
jgi:hypothetical protein